MTKQPAFSQYLAEFIGTYFLVFFGCGAVILAEQKEPALALAIPIVFGGAVATMIYATGHLSGAHFNPAVTFSFWANRHFPSKKLFGYITAQCLGALLASLSHLIIFGSQHSFGSTTFHVSIGVAVFVEFLLSFSLMFVIMAVATDSRAVGELAGLAIGLTVTLCAYVGGPLTAASMNPARSLGPNLLAGQWQVLWIYMFIPFIGTFFGGKVYEWIRCQKVQPQEDC